MNGISLLPASDQSVLVSLGHGISPEVYGRVRRFCSLLEAARHEAVFNFHPAYASVLVAFDPRMASLDEMGSFLEGLISETGNAALPESRLVEIPVCYGGEFGRDLEAVAEHTKLGPEEVIHIHSSAEYFVYFLGFAPGFAYLGGLPESIATPRLPTPRKKVPVGSVGIGGNQTGVYPLATPGGWRLIGRTPMPLFSPKSTPPVLLEMGDRVRFVPMAPEEFDSVCQ
jgi:inhibitor of KinA